MAETKATEHKRLQVRTNELQQEHEALALDVTPFDQADHDQHSENLRRHKADLEKHRARDDDKSD
jgi:hypothetical protein